MRGVTSLTALEKLGRVRLSRHSFLRDFLYSEIGNFHAIPNLPENPDLLIAAGTKLAVELLDPLVETFGPIAVRSSYRSPAVNAFGNANNQNCARNESNYAGHIWDRRDAAGRMGACACIVVPWFADQYERGRDWRDLAWWVHDHLPYHDMWFFPKRAAFNLTWREDPARRIASYIAPKGLIPQEDLAARGTRYADFPPFRGVAYPPVPSTIARAKA
jgi:hypothetical protein